MDVPHFIQHPPTDTELQSAQLLLLGNTCKETGDKRCLSEQTIKAHARSLRFKFHAKNMIQTLGRMLALNFLPYDGLRRDLPPGWEKFIRD